VVNKIVLTPSTWYSIAFAAIEVYPNECMGAVIAEKRKNKGVFALSYQLAKRRHDSVETCSIEYLPLLDPKYYSLADYHSHPSHLDEKDQPIPSKDDFELSPLGNCDIIIKSTRTRSCRKKLLKCERGKIYMHWNRFILIAMAYRRKEKEYVSLPLEIGQ
jgi:proteasome lid subunit RPN8/RPN11